MGKAKAPSGIVRAGGDEAGVGAGVEGVDVSGDAEKPDDGNSKASELFDEGKAKSSSASC